MTRVVVTPMTPALVEFYAHWYKTTYPAEFLRELFVSFCTAFHVVLLRDTKLSSSFFVFLADTRTAHPPTKIKDQTLSQRDL